MEYVKKNEVKNELTKCEWSMNINQKNQLEQWTSLKCSDIVFDSNVENWSKHTSVLNEKIIGKKQLAFVIEDEEGEIFGYYLNTKIIEKKGYQEIDNKSFCFNLQSKDNRLSKPMKFEIKDLKSGISLYEKS